MRRKTAQVNISLSWVFMIFIGAFFIILAYNIIGKYQEIEEYKYEIELKKTLRVIMNNVGRTTGIESNVLEPIHEIFNDRKVNIECVAGKSVLSINDGEIMDTNNEYLQNYPIFMTQISEGSVGYTYMAAENFFMPFKITNMLAIVSKKNLIIFDKNSEISEKFVYKFNKGSYRNLSFHTEDFEDLEGFAGDYVDGKNIDSVIFVSDYDKDFDISSTTADLDVMNYHVKIDELNDKYGTIYYYDSSNELNSSYNYSNWKEDYLSIPTMAIFSEPETFECSYNLLLETIPDIYKFYMIKALNYQNMNKAICSSSIATDSLSEQQYQYQVLYESMEEIKENVKTYKFGDIGSIHQKIDSLSNQNHKLEEFNCPFVY